VAGGPVFGNPTSQAHRALDPHRRMDYHFPDDSMHRREGTSAPAFDRRPGNRWGVTRDPPARDASWLYLIRDLLGFFVWCASYVRQHTVWRNIPYELVGEGRIATRADLLESEIQK
jgi:hypothetical protein